MSTTTEKLKFDPQGFASFLDQLQEPQWSKQQRSEAFEQFTKMRWPDRRNEDWMRSDLRPFKLEKFALGGGIDELESPIRLGNDIDLAGQICNVNTTTGKEWTDPTVSKLGIVFSSLANAINEHSELVQRYLWSVSNTTVDRFAALHAATWAGGAFLYVPADVVVEKPFHIHAAMSDGGFSSGHTLIVLEKNSEATVLCETASLTETDSGFHCGGLEIIVKPGARLRFVNLQDWGLATWHFAQERASIERDASIQWTTAAMGSLFSQVSQQVALNGDGAHSQVNGVMFTRENQQITYNTVQEHIAPHCTSDFLYKAALQDKSRTVWRGMIKVLPGAMKTDGYQRNDNLMLSDSCRADSIPGLEIKADDVRCTHGSTSGRVDEELIFYAQSRGFTRQEAVRLIVTGFFQQIFDRITIESVRKALGEAIARQVRQYQ